jgi:hypothetical protein
MAGVFRFSNAVSDIRKFIDTYKKIYEELKDVENFTHDDATEALIKHGLVSSSGAIGQEAVKRSKNDDRSRDPLYNQLKMYSEIYRMLGWYNPGTKNTNFIIPDYGEYIYEAENNLLLKHYELNVLHIVSPNPLVDIKGRNILRPFPLIVKILDKVGGFIHRDEIILTVLSCANDRAINCVDDAVDYINNLRGSKQRLVDAYQLLMTEHGINSPDVFRNYTRFVMASLKYLGYAEPENRKGIYGDNAVRFYTQTDYGKEKALTLGEWKDIRHEDIEEFGLEERAAFCAYSIYHHLGAIGYDLSDAETMQDIQRFKEICEVILSRFDLDAERGFLYFGYQEATKEERDYTSQLLD